MNQRPQTRSGHTCGQSSVGLALSPETQLSEDQERLCPSFRGPGSFSHAVSVVPFSSLASSPAPYQQPPLISGHLNLVQRDRETEIDS